MSMLLFARQETLHQHQRSNLDHPVSPLWSFFQRDAVSFLWLAPESLNRLDWKDDEPDCPNHQILAIDVCVPDSISSKCFLSTLTIWKSQKVSWSNKQGLKVLAHIFLSAKLYFCIPEVYWEKYPAAIYISSTVANPDKLFHCHISGFAFQKFHLWDIHLSAIYPDECIIGFLSRPPIISICATHLHHPINNQ